MGVWANAGEATTESNETNMTVAPAAASRRFTTTCTSTTPSAPAT